MLDRSFSRPSCLFHYWGLDWDAKNKARSVDPPGKLEETSGTRRL